MNRLVNPDEWWLNHIHPGPGGYYWSDECDDLSGPVTFEEAVEAVKDYACQLDTGLPRYAAQMAHGV